MLHLSAGVSGEVQCFGSLEFWMRLKVPMQQTLRLYRERLSALGYVNTALKEERPVGEHSFGFAIGFLNDTV